MIFALIGVACSPLAESNIAAAPTSAVSVLLLTLDTTRADHLAPYGGSAPTPVYTQFAKQGMLFSRASIPYPLTIPSHATILTGKTPPTHGVRDNGEFLLGQEQVTLAERFEQLRAQKVRNEMEKE